MNISNKAYLEDVKNGERLSVLKSIGIPFSPDQKKFDNDTLIYVSLCFPKISFSFFNLIDVDNSHGFNVYGINLNDTYNYTYSIDKYAHCYQEASLLNSLGKTTEDAICKKEQLKMAKYLFGLRSYESATVLYDLCLNNNSNPDSAIAYGEDALQIMKVLPRTDIVKMYIAEICASLMTYMIGRKDYAKGFSYGEESLSIRNTLRKRYDDPNYVNFLRQLIDNYAQAGYASNAAFHSKELLNVYKEKSHENPDFICDYIIMLLNLGEYCIEANSIEEARKFTNEAFSLQGGNNCNTPEILFQIYNNLAYTEIGNIDKAIDYYKKAQDIGTNKNVDTIKYAQSLRLLGNLYAKGKKDTINAIRCYEKALFILEKNENNRSLAQLAQVYDALGFIYYNIDSNKSQNYCNKYIEIIGKLYGNESIFYGNALKYKSVREFWSYMKNNNNKDILVSDISNSINIIKRYLDTAMLSSTPIEKTQLWQENKELFDWWIPFVAFFLDSDETNALSFDASLFYKGYMMSMENDVKMQLLNSENDSIKNLHNRYLSNLNLLEKVNNSPDSRTINIDSLKKTITTDELFLTNIVFNSGFKFNKANLSWKDIQNSISDNDVVIEFISFDGKNIVDDNEYYIALVLNRKLTAPKMVRLFKMNDLKELLKESNPNYKKISELIWNESLLTELDGFKNVFFSPAGCLNSIGIEYLPISNNENINDKYKVYRLSSSRELYNRNKNIKLKNAVLYGDLDYNWMQGRKASNGSNNKNGVISFSRSLVESMSSRGGFDVLENTLEEISNISKVLSKSGIENKVFSGGTGTEESFKNLSGKDISIIHLATHGMYITPSEALQKKSEQNLKFINSDAASIFASDKSLTRSALIMSGGNKLIRRDSISWEEEDEILTALEIAALDFRNLDLVVLSACQTGLGDVGSEGVYGLQRGFKKAGANSILMSLNNIDDYATRILMVEFYRNLMKGKAKQQSLQEAQQYLRKVDNGKYDDPKYWASFIMLDGLN